jgi:biopolymer transport protein ExbD
MLGRHVPVQSTNDRSRDGLRSEVVSGPNQRWQVRKIGDSNVAKISGEELSQYVARRLIGPGHQVRLEGSTEWLSVAQATPFIVPPPEQSAPNESLSSPRTKGPPAATNPPAPSAVPPRSTSSSKADSAPRWKSGFPDSASLAALPTLTPATRGRRPPVTGSNDNELDMTPMIDMTFLLLIFFMVTSTISPFADLQLPEAKAGDAQKPEGRVVLVLDYDKGHVANDKPRFSGAEFIELKDCRMYLADDSENIIPPAALQEFLSEALAQSGGGEFILQSNRKMPVGVVREVVKIAKAAGAGETMIGVARPR